MKFTFSTETHQISWFGRDEKGLHQRKFMQALAPSVKIYESRVQPGTYIFFREKDEGQFDGSASTMHLWTPSDQWLPDYEVRENGTSLDDPHLMAFSYNKGDSYIGGSSVAEVEARLQGHFVRDHYHAWDCGCDWCTEKPHTGKGKDGWHYWIPSNDSPAPILMATTWHDKDAMIAADVHMGEVGAIDTCSQEYGGFYRLTLPKGTKLAIPGGWFHYQLPNGLEITQKNTYHYDEIDGERTGSSYVEKVEPHWCFWSDSLNRQIKQRENMLDDTDNHPF